MKLGIAGRLTQAFIASPLTPLILLASLALGLIALVTLPREEEPQISVPMVDIHVRADGLKAEDAVKLVTEPLETIVKSIDGVEHVYSQTHDDGAVVTARFVVGTSSDAAILRVHDKVRANLDRIPVGIPEPLIVGRGIDDVAIVVVTLTPKPEAAARWTAAGLTRLARELQVEVTKLPDIGLTYIVGEQPDEIRVEPDPEKLSLYGVTLQQLAAKVAGANRSFDAGTGARGRPAARRWSPARRCRPFPRSATCCSPPATAARSISATSPTWSSPPSRTRTASTDIRKAGDGLERASRPCRSPSPSAPAPTPSSSPRTSSSGSTQVRGQIFPADVEMTVTRDYGETANEKANELLFHLGLATISIIVLVAVAIGWREAIVVAVVIPTTILLTLFASWIMGYTLNRVSLFALIFSIGILVDDAIVVIENISRHWAMNDGRSRTQAAIEAVAEVGNPTIVATLTVVAALLPMLFVSGLMGPYMSPIPANASAAMLFSFFVAVILTPWLMMRVRPEAGERRPRSRRPGASRPALRRASPGPSSPSRTRVLDLPCRRRESRRFASLALFYTQNVTVKLLPFDNKTDLQVVVDLPEGSSVEDTDRVLQAAVDRAGENSRGRLVPDLCRHRRAVQFQRAGPPLLSPLVAGTGRRPGQPPAEGRAQPRQPRRSRSTSASSCAGSPCPPARRSRWSSRRRDRRCSRRFSPRSTAPTPMSAAPWPPRCARHSRACPSSSTSTIPTAPAPTACGSAIDQDNLEYHHVEQEDVYDAIRSSSPARPSAIRIAAAAASRSRSSSA